MPNIKDGIEPKIVRQHTLNWIKQVVIKESFCPFAAHSLQKNELDIDIYSIERNVDSEKSYIEIVAHSEKLCLSLIDEQVFNNAILVIPSALEDFDEFLDVIYLVELWLEKSGFEQYIQLAHFHPSYKFEDEGYDDPTNYTNRSPYPMLHFLKVKDVAKAVEHYPDIEQIPERNKQRAKQLGSEHFVNIINTIINH